MNRPVRHLAGDPDPRYVEPGPVRRYQPPRQAHRDRSGMVIVYLAAMLVVILAACLIVAAPRGASDPSSSAHPTAPDQALRGAPLSLPGSDPAGLRGDGGSIPQAVQGGVPLTARVGLTGLATYYDAPNARHAAAGPALRASLGRHWRGTTVTVCKLQTQVGPATPLRRCVDVRLTDWCACGDRHGQPTLIDLDARAFATLIGVRPGSRGWRDAIADRGVISVTIAAGRGPSPTLPPTDTAR